MSSNLIEIVLRLKNELGNTLTQAQQQLNGLAQATQQAGATAGSAGGGLNSLGQAANQAGQAVANGATHMGTASTAAVQMATQLEGAARGFQTLLKAGIAFATAGFLKGLADAAGRTEQLGIVLKTVGNNAGISSPELDRMDKSIQKMGITASASRDSLTKLIQAGLISSETGYKAAQLARAAQDLAVVTGQNSSETFQRLITNIQQMDSMGLRFMGLTVDIEKAQERYANSLDKSTAELTQQEKQQGVMNAALAEAAKLSGTYEASMGSAAKQAASLARYQEELKVSLGNNLLPAYLALVEGVTEFIKTITKSSDEMGASGEIARGLGNAVKALMTTINDATKFAVEHKDAILAIAGAWALLKVPAAMNAILGILGVANFSFISLRATLAGVTAGFAQVGAAAVASGGTAAGAFTLLNTVLAGTLTGLRAIAATTGAALFGGIGAGITGLISRIPFIGTAFSAVGGVISGTLAAAATGVKLLVGSIGLVGAVFAAWEIGSFIGNWLNGFDTIKDAARVVVSAIMDTFGAILNVGGNIGTRLKQIGATIVAALTPGKSASDTWDAWGKKVEESNKKVTDSYAQTKDAIKDFGKGGDSTELLNQADELAKKYVEQKMNVAGLRKELDDAREAASKGNGDPTLIAQLEKDATEAEEKFKKTSKELAELKAKASDKVKLQIDAKVETVDVEQAKMNIEFNKVKDKMEAAKKAAGLDKLQLIDGNQVSQDFAAISAATKTLTELFATPFVQKYAGEVRTVGATAREVENALVKLAASAKTPEEIAVAMKRLEQAMDAVGQSGAKIPAYMQQLKLTMQFNQQEAEIKKLDEAMKGFTARMQTVQSAMQAIRDVQNSQAQGSQAFAAAMVQLGLNATNTSTAIERMRLGLVSFKDASSQMAQIDISKQTQAFNDLNLKYQEDVRNLQNAVNVKKQLVAESSRSDADKITATKAIDQATLAERLQMAQKHYKALEQIQNEALQKFQQYMEKAKSIEQAIQDNRTSQAKNERDVSRSFMDEEQKKADFVKEMYEKREAAAEAFRSGDLEKGKKLAQEEIELAKQIATDETRSMEERQAAARLVTEGHEQIEEALKKEKAEALKAAQEQAAVYENMTNALKDVAKAIEGMGKEQIAQVKVELDGASMAEAKTQIEREFATGVKSTVVTEIDQGALQNAANAIKNQLESVQITIKANIQATKEGQGYATGGFIWGPGTETSDSIPARLSRGEYVIKAAAVRNFGVGFFDSLNSLMVPGFATGGLVGDAVASGRAATSGEASVGSSGGPESVVNISLGGKKATLRGQREQVRNLVDMLKTM